MPNEEDWTKARADYQVEIDKWKELATRYYLACRLHNHHNKRICHQCNKYEEQQ